MFKQNRGITLVSLVVTVIVMIILIGVTIESGTELIISSKFKTIETNMMLIQSRAEVLYEKYTFDGTLTFDGGGVATINITGEAGSEQEQSAKALKTRQIFANDFSVSAIENVPTELESYLTTEMVQHEMEYYDENARFERLENGKANVDSNTNTVKKESLFDGTENSQTNWMIWDKNYVLSQVSDKIDMDEDEYFLVNIYTHEVLYSAGFKDKDGTLYFLLSDMKVGK